MMKQRSKRLCFFQNYRWNCYLKFGTNIWKKSPKENWEWMGFCAAPVEMVRPGTLIASTLRLLHCSLVHTLHPQSFIRSYFDVIKWKPYKNWVAPVTSSHIARRRVIIHPLSLFCHWKGECGIKKECSCSCRGSNKTYTANKPLTTCEIRE